MTDPAATRHYYLITLRTRSLGLGGAFGPTTSARPIAESGSRINLGTLGTQAPQPLRGGVS
ncbi:MAG: hypothetical protein ACREQ5_12055, partial [Candidatus Dormibacteria bacterium]